MKARWPVAQLLKPQLTSLLAHGNVEAGTIRQEKADFNKV